MNIVYFTLLVTIFVVCNAGSHHRLSKLKRNQQQKRSLSQFHRDIPPKLKGDIDVSLLEVEKEEKTSSKVEDSSQKPSGEASGEDSYPNNPLSDPVLDSLMECDVCNYVMYTLQLLLDEAITKHVTKKGAASEIKSAGSGDNKDAEAPSMATRLLLITDELVKQEAGALCSRLHWVYKSSCDYFMTHDLQAIVDMYLTLSEPEDVCKRLAYCVHAPTYAEDFMMYDDTQGWHEYMRNTPYISFDEEDGYLFDVDVDETGEGLEVVKEEATTPTL